MMTSCDLGRSSGTNLRRHTADQYQTSPAKTTTPHRAWMVGSSMDYDHSDDKRWMEAKRRLDRAGRSAKKKKNGITAQSAYH